MRNICVFILMFCLPVVGIAQENDGRMRCNHSSVVDFCDLIKDPDKYEGRTVTVRATYIYGFELSSLYCVNCIEKPVWVEFDDSFKENTNSKYRKSVGDNGSVGRTVNVEAVGILRSGGFGHMSAYDFMFMIEKINSAEIVANKGVGYSALSTHEQEKVCQR